MNSRVNIIQIEGNNTVSFLLGTNYVNSMSQVMPQIPTYISYGFDGITITQDGVKSFQFTIYEMTQVGGNTFVPLNSDNTSKEIQDRTIEIYRLLVTSIFKGCCECGNTEPECSIQYTAGGDANVAGTFYDGGSAIRINYFTANNQDFTGFWPIVQDGSWIFVFSKTDPTVYGVYQLSNYTDGGPGLYAQFNATLLAGPAGFPEGTSLCVDVTSVGGNLVQTWQETLVTGSILDQNNTIDGGGFDLTFDNNTSFTANSAAGSLETDATGARIVSGAQSVEVTSTYVDIITPNHGTATTGMVLALDASGHVEYVSAGTGSGTVTSIDVDGGTGISVSPAGPITTSGTFTVTNTAPDQTVVLTDGTGISTTGAYPNFTITNTAPDQTVSLGTTGTGLAVTGTYPSFTLENTLPDQTVAISSGTGINVTGTYPNFTIDNTAPGVTYDSNEGIYKDTSLTNDTFQLGFLTEADSKLPGNDFSVTRHIYTDTFRLDVRGLAAVSDGVLYVENESTNAFSTGLLSVSQAGSPASSSAIEGRGEGGKGVVGSTKSVTSFGGQFGTISSVQNTVKDVLSVFSTALGGGQVGLGGDIVFSLSHDNSTSWNAGRVGYEATSVTSAGDAATSTFFVSTKETGVVQPVNKMEIDTAGQVKFNNYGQTPANFPDPSPVSALGVDATGNVVEFSVPSAGGSIPFGTASGTDTYTVTITGVTAYTDGDAYIIRFTNGNTDAATLNINAIGAKALYRNNDGALIGGDIWDGGEMLCIYNSVLDGFDCIGTSPNSLFAYVTNDQGATITRGQAVIAFGGTGNRITVKLAQGNSDANSAQTLGFVFSTSIAANQKGIIIIQGYFTDLSLFPPSAGWVNGDTVYLSPTVAGAVTRVKPLAPEHLVYLGVVANTSPGTAGRMYVRVQNGYEMNELHDVQSTGAVNNDVLYRDTTVTPNLWKPTQVSTLLGATTVGTNLITIPNPSATRYLRINSDNTVTAITLAELKSDIGVGGYVALTTDYVTSGTAYQNITGFSFPVVSGKTYKWRATILVVATATTNGMLSTSGPTGTTTYRFTIGTGGTTNTINNGIAHNTGSAVSMSTSLRIASADGIFQATANGNLSMSVISSVSGAFTVKAGSVIEYEEVI